MKITKKHLKKIIREELLFSEGLLYHLREGISLSKSIYRPGSKAFFDLINEARYNKDNFNLSNIDKEIIESDLGKWGLYEGREVALDFPIDEEADDMMMVADKGYKASEEILSKIFTNELGNEIEVEVRSSKYDDFLDNEDPYEGVFIRLTCPNSEISHVMTKMEAKVLFKLLGNYFKEDIFESKNKKSGSYYKGKKVSLNQPKRGGEKKFYVYVKDPKTGNIRKVAFGAKGMSTGLRNPARRKSFKARHNCEDKNDKTKPGYWACRIGRYPSITGAPYVSWW
jgi:hypothetical protein